MGEYAKRKSDLKVVKIGTCKSMYYLRYEDRGKLISLDNSIDLSKEWNGVFWRLPIPEEDDIKPGDYESNEVSLEFDKKYEFYSINYHCRLYNNDFFNDLADEPKYKQLIYKELGMLVYIDCYHGVKLNDATGEVRFGWNGKTFPLALNSIKNTEKEMRIVICCTGCKKKMELLF